MINEPHSLCTMNQSYARLTCVQVYAPTTSVETADIEDFYRNLHSVLNEILRKDVLIHMGDRNSK
jgi:hypothetical protein